TPKSAISFSISSAGLSLSKPDSPMYIDAYGSAPYLSVFKNSSQKSAASSS
ncbi:hypothetical protein D030_1115B, partial [Vibrio parahaemolyticus AQ3810]